MNKENKLIKHIKSGDKTALEAVYTRFRKEFLLYTTRFPVSDEDALDIYQDAVVVLYENIISGKLNTLSSSLKTYLFSIGKYQLYNRLKLKIATEDIANFEFILKEEKQEEFLMAEENIAKLQRAYNELGEQCQKVLKLFYHDNLTLEDIMVNLNYNSKDVVKSQKSRCLKQLKEILSMTDNETR
jgi:RNA polymerase sigma factor (sigma-70 family)